MGAHLCLYEGGNLLDRAANVRLRMTGILRHERRMELDPEPRRSRPHGRDRHDRHLVFQRHPRRPGRRHRFMTKEGNGDALVELLVVHQRHRRAARQGAHQLARADALRRIDLRTIGRAQVRDPLVDMRIVQRPVGHHGARNALGDRRRHDFPVGEMARDEDRALAALADRLQHVEAHDLDPSARVRINRRKMRHLAGRAASAFPGREGRLFDPPGVPIGKGKAQVAPHRLVLRQRRADLPHQPAAKVRGLVRPQRLHRAPVDQVPGHRLQPPLNPLPEGGAVIDVLRADIVGRRRLAHGTTRLKSGASSASTAAASSNTAFTGNTRTSGWMSGGRRT